MQQLPAGPQEDLIRLYLLQQQQSCLKILLAGKPGAYIHELLAILLRFLHPRPQVHIEIVVPSLLLEVRLLQRPEDDHAVRSHSPGVHHHVAVLGKRE